MNHDPDRERLQIPALLWMAPQGWERLLLDCHAEVVALDPDYYALSLRCDSGALVLIIQPSLAADDRLADLDAAVERYQDWSKTVCAICGAPGRWHRIGDKWGTRCRAHWGDL
jgi:hypothetical protein